MAATRIDCDIHPAVGGTRTTLLPCLDDRWKQQLVSRANDGLDLSSYRPNSGPYVAGTFPVQIEDGYVIVGT